MRDWHRIWADAEVGEEGGPDWNEPETYVETVSLLARRGEEWLECLTSLRDREPSVAELAGERFLVEVAPTDHRDRWTYRLVGAHSGKRWGELTLETDRLDELVLLVLVRTAFNGRGLTAPEELETLEGLLTGKRVDYDSLLPG